MWVQGHSPRAHWEKTQTNGNWTRRTGVASHYPERLTDSHRRSLSDTVYETTTSVWYQRSLLLKVASTHPQPSFVYAAFDSKWFTGIKVQSRISDHSGSHLWAQIILWSVFAHVCAESSVTSYRDYECCTADSRQLDLHSAILMWVSSQQKAQDRREHWEHIEEAMHSAATVTHDSMDKVDFSCSVGSPRVRSSGCHILWNAKISQATADQEMTASSGRWGNGKVAPIGNTYK